MAHSTNDARRRAERMPNTGKPVGPYARIELAQPAPERISRCPECRKRLSDTMKNAEKAGIPIDYGMLAHIRCERCLVTHNQTIMLDKAGKVVKRPAVKSAERKAHAREKLVDQTPRVVVRKATSEKEVVKRTTLDGRVVYHERNKTQAALPETERKRIDSIRRKVYVVATPKGDLTYRERERRTVPSTAPRQADRRTKEPRLWYAEIPGRHGRIEVYAHSRGEAKKQVSAFIGTAGWSNLWNIYEALPPRK